MVHALKISPEYFGMIINDEKPYEIRKKDRPYKIGDYIALNEYEDGFYTGRCTFARIVRIVEYADCLKEGYLVLTLEPIAIQQYDSFQSYGLKIKRETDRS